jgi:hypothetical protein
VEKSLTLALALLALAGCSQPNTPASEARVWSTSSSSDGFASCSADTSVVGGGFEINEGALGPGREVRVIASRPHGNGWRVDCVDERGVLTTGCKAWVVCATVLR